LGGGDLPTKMKTDTAVHRVTNGSRPFSGNSCHSGLFQSLHCVIWCLFHCLEGNSFIMWKTIALELDDCRKLSYIEKKISKV